MSNSGGTIYHSKGRLLNIYRLNCGHWRPWSDNTSVHACHGLHWSQRKTQFAASRLKVNAIDSFNDVSTGMAYTNKLKTTSKDVVFGPYCCIYISVLYNNKIVRKKKLFIYSTVTTILNLQFGWNNILWNVSIVIHHVLHMQLSRFICNGTKQLVTRT